MARNVFGPAMPGVAVNVTRVVVAKSAPVALDVRRLGRAVVGRGVGVQARERAGESEHAERRHELDRDDLS